MFIEKETFDGEKEDKTSLGEKFLKDMRKRHCQLSSFEDSEFRKKVKKIVEKEYE